jgi:tol-pal system protein YbgF
MVPKTRALMPTLAVGLMLAASAASHAQHAGAGPSSPGAFSERMESFGRDASGFFGQIFGGSERGTPPRVEEPPYSSRPQTMAQISSSDIVLRLDRLENHIRQLTGVIEQLQFRNQQLEQQLRRLQQDVEYRFQEQTGHATAQPPPQARAPAQVSPTAPSPPASGRRGDAFDPSENPGAPGAPRTLGTLPGSAIPADPPEVIEAPIGAPGGRRGGPPRDLATLSAEATGQTAAAGGTLPPPPPRNPSATGAQVAMLPPNATARDEYDLAYGYVLRKDYALAEEAFRTFLKRHPNDRLAADAHYWLGESLYQRQRYRDAAEAFLTVSTTYEKSPKAPDALLRLGQSLAALNEKEAACATFIEIGRRYPRASSAVKQTAAAEQKRVC